MADGVLLREDQGVVATLTLNRPDQFNALNDELRQTLRDAVRDIEADDAIRVVILKGNGRGFCAGADLAGGLEVPVSGHIEREYKPALTGIAESSKIWIAQVHGTAAGIGAAFAMNCDLMTMADDATVYMAFAAISLIPDGGNTQLLLQNMGYHRALQAVLEGRKIPAEECLQYGIANKLMPKDELDAGTLQWANDLASGAPLSMAAAKRLLRHVGQIPYADAISAEGLEQDPLSQSEDFKEGVAAFFRKEKPVFSGC
ncbi:MAG: enoyl-CoA hydratase-related protein [Pseudomonadota bacterium]